MGLFDRMRSALAKDGGVVGTAPSEAHATPLDLIHAAVDRFEHSRARAGGWLSAWALSPTGKELGVIQYPGEGIINLCTRDDIDLATLLRSAGREDLAARCEERSSALFAIRDATLEEVVLVIDLVITVVFGSPPEITVMAEIDGG